MGLMDEIYFSSDDELASVLERADRGAAAISATGSDRQRRREEYLTTIVIMGRGYARAIETASTEEQAARYSERRTVLRNIYKRFAREWGVNVCEAGGAEAQEGG